MGKRKNLIIKNSDEVNILKRPKKIFLKAGNRRSTQFEGYTGTNGCEPLLLSKGADLPSST